jgi:hypothetical protein
VEVAEEELLAVMEGHLDLILVVGEGVAGLQAEAELLLVWWVYLQLFQGVLFDFLSVLYHRNLHSFYLRFFHFPLQCEGVLILL